MPPERLPDRAARKYVTLTAPWISSAPPERGSGNARARVEHRGRTTCEVSITVDDGQVRYMPAPASPFLHRPPLSRGRPPGRQTLSGRFSFCYCPPAKRATDQVSANGRPATLALSRSVLHRLAQPPPLLRLGLQRLLQRRQGPQPSVRGGVEYRPGVRPHQCCSGPPMSTLA